MNNDFHCLSSLVFIAVGMSFVISMGIRGFIHWLERVIRGCRMDYALLGFRNWEVGWLFLGS